MLWLAGLVVTIVVLLSFLVSSKSAEAKIDLASSLRRSHMAQDVINDDQTAIGLNPVSKTLVVVSADGFCFRYSYSHLAEVALTPFFTRKEVGEATTRVNRGAQIMNAGLGATLAGPVGLTIGALSAESKMSYETTISSESLNAVELTLRLFSESQPLVKVRVLHNFAAVEMLAAHLANAIDQRPATEPFIPAPVALKTELITFKQAREEGLRQNRAGWLARAFGL